MRPLRRLVVIPSIGLALLWPAQEAAAKRSGEGGTAGQNSPPKQEERKREKGYDDRIDKKCLAGALGGVAGGLAGAAIMVGIDDGSFGWEIPALMGFWGGNVVGTAVGVSAVDPHDNLRITLAGSVVGGVGVPFALGSTFRDEEFAGPLLLLSAFLGPIVGSTIASELWRNPHSPVLDSPENRQILVSLLLQHKRGFISIATLRF